MAKGDMVEKVRARERAKLQMAKEGSIQLPPSSSIRSGNPIGKQAIKCIKRGTCLDCPTAGDSGQECNNPSFDKRMIADIKQGRVMNVVALCYVCHQGVLKSDRFKMLPADATSPSRFRHDDCAPGSDIWHQHVPPSEGPISAEVRRITAMAKAKKAAKKEEKEKTPKVTKPSLTTEDISTLGRIKYMAYMDTVLMDAGENRPKWEIKGGNFSAVSNPDGHEVTIKAGKNSHTVPTTKVSEFVQNIKKGTVTE